MSASLAPSLDLIEIVVTFLASVVGKDPADLAKRVLQVGVGTALEEAGYDDIGCEGPAISDESAAMIVRLLGSDNVDVQELSALALRYIPRRQDNCKTLVNAGACPAMVRLLQRGSRGAVAGSIGLTLEAPGVAAMIAAGAVELILPLLTDGAEENAIAVVTNLACEDDGRAALVAKGAIPHLINIMDRGTDRGKEESAKALWNIARGPEHVAHVVNAGGVASLVALLNSDAQPAVVNATRALARIAEVADGEEGRIGLAAVVALLRTGSNRVKRAAARALWHVSSEHDQCRRLIDAGVIAPLVALLIESARESWRPSLLVHALLPQADRGGITTVLALSRADARGELRHPTAMIGQLPPELLCYIFEYTTAPPAAGAFCSAIVSNVAYEGHRAELVAAGAVAPLVTLVRRGSIVEKEEAAAALWGVCDNRALAHTLVTAGAVPPLVEVLRGKAADDKELLAGARERSAGALQAIMFEADAERLVVEAGGVPPLVALLKEGTDEAKLNAALAVWRLARTEFRSLLVEAGAEQPLRALSLSGSAEQQSWALTCLMEFSTSYSKVPT